MKKRVLQLNLDGTGGAFSLIYQIQKCMSGEYIFDFYWMGKFVHSSRSDELEKNGSKIYEADLRKNRLLGHILLPWRFYQFLKLHHYDIVHINADLAYKVLLYEYPAYKAGVRKIVIHSHSSGINGDHKRLKYVLHRLCKPFIRRFSDTFLTCSKLASQWMYGRKISATMINNGVDLKRFRFRLDDRKRIRNELKLTDQILIGTVGNLSFQKNPEFFVDILKRLPEDKYKGIFVGDGQDLERIQKYVDDNGMSDQIIFYGNTDHVEDVLCAMDIFLMPSRFEGLPVSAIEAQASGLPSLLSENITRETKILLSCDFLPINLGSGVWAEKIKTIKIGTADRSVAVDMLKIGEWDIVDSAKELELIYSDTREEKSNGCS